MKEIIKAYTIGGDRAVTLFLNQHPLIYCVDGYDDPNPDLDDYDMMVFTGGCDVHPKYYGQKLMSGTYPHEPRDVNEFSYFFKTKDTHYHFGICRGLQLLGVAHGSRLWQDVTGHSGLGVHGFKPVKGTSPFDYVEGVTSLHHQAIRLDNRNRHNILAFEGFKQPVTVKSPDFDKRLTINKVVEAAYFDESRSFGVQGHPEYNQASEEFKKYVFYHLIEDERTGFYSSKQK